MSTAAKILLIEDDAGITDTLHRVLVEEGHEVLVEERGDDGLARAGKEAFNVVITDLRLPGLNGLELVRQLHTAQPRLPIILITGYASHLRNKHGFEILRKPCAPYVLLAALRRATGQTAAV